MKSVLTRVLDLMGENVMPEIAVLLSNWDYSLLCIVCPPLAIFLVKGFSAWVSLGITSVLVIQSYGLFFNLGSYPTWALKWFASRLTMNKVVQDPGQAPSVERTSTWTNKLKTAEKQAKISHSSLSLGDIKRLDLNERLSRFCKACILHLISISLALRTIFDGNSVPILCWTLATIFFLNIPSATLSNLPLSIETVTAVNTPPPHVPVNPVLDDAKTLVKKPEPKAVVVALPPPATVVPATVPKQDVKPALLALPPPAKPLPPKPVALESLKLETAKWYKLRSAPGAPVANTSMVADPALWSVGVFNDDPHDAAKGGTFQVIPGPGMTLRWSFFKLMSWPSGIDTITTANIKEVNRKSKVIAFIVTDAVASAIVYMPKIRCWLKKAIGAPGMTREEMLQRLDNNTFGKVKDTFASTCMDRNDSNKVLVWDWRTGYWQRTLTTSISSGGPHVRFADQDIPF